MHDQSARWKRCSSCKKEIDFQATHWVCSVSTCTRKRTGMVFCSVACWEVHLPMMRHREAYAVEQRAPTQAAWLREQAEEAAEAAAAAPAEPAATPASVAPMRRRVAVAAPASEGDADSDDAELEQDILVVASKLKKYIRARSGMNTSDGVMAVLSDHLRALCDEAIRNAARDSRKTVLDRDIPQPG